MIVLIGPSLSFENAARKSGRLLRFDCATRRTTPAFLLAMLAFAVFFWGLRYKLSLYRSETTQRPSPAAKLLSQRERPIVSNDANSAYTSYPIFLSGNGHYKILIPAIAVALCLATLLWSRNPITREECVRQDCTHLFDFLPRPPPALFPLDVAVPSM